MDKQALLSNLPSVDELLKSEEGMQWKQKFPRRLIIQAIRVVLNNLRKTIIEGAAEEINRRDIIHRINALAEDLSGYSLRPCMNATGVVLHTNLGRSVLCREVIEHVTEIAGNYSNLEYDIERGVRSKRYSHLRRLLNELTGAEDCIIVNNNAAATLVCLAALAKGKR